MTTPPSGSNSEVAARRIRRWKRITRLLQVALACSIGFAAWSVALADDDSPPPVLPDVDEQFSLDLEVIDSTDDSLVYVVEQRARPAYRIFSFDPSNGDVETVFTVPADAIVYGIALSSDRETLAISYSPDYEIDGSGISTVDLTGDLPVGPDEFVEIIEPQTDRYLVDLAWDENDAILATLVDRRPADDQLSVVAVDTADRSIQQIALDAVDPTPLGGATYFLEVDDELARRTIGAVDGNGVRTSFASLERDMDLDQLVAVGGSLRVAAVEVDSGGLTFGTTAKAHGNHDVPSAWWAVTIDEAASGAAWIPTRLDQTIVYDAASTANGFVYATREGLSFVGEATSGDKVDVIASRALRFVAA